MIFNAVENLSTKTLKKGRANILVDFRCAYSSVPKAFFFEKLTPVDNRILIFHTHDFASSTPGWLCYCPAIFSNTFEQKDGENKNVLTDLMACQRDWSYLWLTDVSTISTYLSRPSSKRIQVWICCTAFKSKRYCSFDDIFSVIGVHQNPI